MLDGQIRVRPGAAPTASKRLGEQLLAAAAITPEQLEDGLRLHSQAGVRLGQALTNLGFTSEATIATALTEQVGVPFVDLETVRLDPSLARLLPKEVERERGILPIAEDGDEVV